MYSELLIPTNNYMIFGSGLLGMSKEFFRQGFRRHSFFLRNAIFSDWLPVGSQATERNIGVNKAWAQDSNMNRGFTHFKLQ